MVPERVKKYRSKLDIVSRDLDIPFEDARKEDLRKLIERINARVDYADWAKRDYRLFVKKFFGWLHDKEFVSWIRVGNVRETVGPQDVLEESELSRLRYACESLRDKALIETLYETDCRPQELLSLNKSDITFDDYGTIVHVRKGKTGRRRIRVVNAAPLLANWVQHHPLKDRDASLWVGLGSNKAYARLS